MSAVTKTLEMASENAALPENVKALLLTAHNTSTAKEKINFYNTWAQNYDQDVAVLEYRAYRLAANSISTHFHGDRDAAVVLDVACGTGMVAKEMNAHGFKHFVGVDGSEGMMEVAKSCGLYQELKKSMLGEEPIPVQPGSFDVVVIAGALSVNHVPISVIRELCNSAKSGGYICMTTRANADNLKYKVAMEDELKQMEREKLWTCVDVSVVEDWERAVRENEHGYIAGAVYLYQKL